MIKIKEEIKGDGITLQGNIPDILTYLEREQERCGKISVLQYIRQRKLENSVGNQFGTNNMRRGYDNVLRR